MEYGAGPSDYLPHPGPADTELLILQNTHRSEVIWNNAVIVKYDTSLM